MDWNVLLKDLLYAVITAAVPILTAFALKFFSKYFNKISLETDQLIISDTINESLDLIMKVVSSTSQTYVDSLKASGEFTKEAQKKAFNETKDTIMNLLSEESKELLATLYQDIDAWLTVQIESAVREQKSNPVKEGE